MAEPSDEYLRRALSGRTPKFSDAPQVPTPDDPGVRESEARLLRTAIERFELADPGPTGQANAGDLLAKYRDRPAPVPAQPTLLEQAALSFLPRRVRADGRPSTLADVPEFMRKELKNKVVGVLDPLGVWRQLGVWKDDPDVGSDAEGLPAESDALWALRVIGSTSPALVTETVKRAPAPDVDRAVRAAREGAFAEAAARFFSPSTLGEQVLGWDPVEGQRVKRDNALANWAQGVLEKIERGDGFETDLALTAKTRLGEEWESTGWWIGLALDVVTNWEGALGATATAIPKLAARMKAIGELAPALSGLERFAAAVRGGELDVAEWAAGKLVADFEAGKLAPEDLPTDVRVALDEVALREFDETIDELLDDAGVIRAPKVSDAEFTAVRDDIAVAQKESAKAEKEAAKAAKPQPVEIGTLEQGQPIVRLSDGADLTYEDIVKVGGGKRKGKKAEAVKVQVKALDADGNEVMLDPADVGVRPEPPNRSVRRRGDKHRDPEEPARSPLPEPPISKAPKDAPGAWRYAADQAKYAPPEGWDLPRGHLGSLIPGVNAITVEDPVYVLRTANGDVIRQGTFAQVSEALLRKPRAGDEIWHGNIRPVARWAKTRPKWVRPSDYRTRPHDLGEWRLTHDYHFATRSEVALVSNLRTLDPRATGRPLKVAADATPEAASAAEALHKQLVDVVTRAPKPGTAQPQTDAGRALVEAFRTAAARKLGETRVKALPNGAIVPVSEHPRVMKQTHEVLGMDGARAREVIGGAPLTAPEVQRVAALGARYGVDVSNGLTAPAWMTLRNAVLREVVGALGDVRYRVQGTVGFVDRLFGAVSDLHLDRRLRGPVLEYLRRSPVAALTNALLDDRLGRLPQPIRQRLKELRVGLERNLDDMINEYNAAKGTRTERLLSMIGGYDVVAPAVARQAIRLLAEPKMDTLYDVVRSLPTRPRWAEWKEPGAQMDMALAWARRTRDEAAVQGREWVRSVLLTRGDEVVGTLDANLIDQLDAELALRIHDEVFDRGDLLGEATLEAFTALRVVQGGWNETQALITHAIRMRADLLVDRAMNDLVASGFAVTRGDVRQNALSAVLKGTHRVWDKAHERWTYLFPEAQLTWAHERLRDWGIDPGANAAIKPTRLGRRDVLIPAYLEAEVRRLVQSANADSRTVYDSKLFDDLLRFAKEMTTHGYLLPNPGYFMGQMIGVWSTMFTTRGLSGTVDVARQMLAHPIETRELMRRLAGGPLFQGRSASAFHTDAGDVITYDMLEDVGRRFGLQDTPSSFEAAARFREFVMQDNDLGALDFRRLRFAAGAWQQLIREWAGTFDQAARVASFIADAKRGIPLEQAAMSAREALLDFRALTPIEAAWGRRAFMFYAFMRKNIDAYVKAAFHHPSRVAAQARLAEASLTDLSGLSELELAEMREEDLGRLVVYQDEEVANDEGRFHPLYRMQRLSSTPMGVVEALLTIRAFLSPLGGTQQSREKLLGYFNPALQSLAILMQGRKLDREFEGPAANRIPPWLVEFPGLSPWVRTVFGVGPTPLRSFEDPLLDDEDATAEIGSAVPAVWAAGGDPTLTPEQRDRARRNWQIVKAWLGRPMGTIEDLAQVVGWQEVDPTMTWSEHALATATGLRWIPVLNEEEAIRRGLLRRGNRMEDAAAELKVPR